MKSSLPKVLHRVAGKPMLEYVLGLADRLAPETVTIVVGHLREALEKGLADHTNLTFVTQEPQLGTGHALLQTAPALEPRQGVVLLLSGDVPLLRSHTLATMLA